MTDVLGRQGTEGDAGVDGRLGRYLAPDGSDGAPVAVDLDRPHAAVVVGKRGSGKSYTLGVLAEELGRTRGVTGVVVDPMGVFGGLARGGAAVVGRPRVAVDAVPPRAWPALLDLDSTSAAGSLLWRAATDAGSLAEIRAAVESASVPEPTRRAVANHLDLAASWDVFDPDGLAADDLLAGSVTVLDCSGMDPAPTSALARAVATGLYRRAVVTDVSPLPWLLVDEAHARFDDVAGPALRTLLTRGRQPGVSLVLATQRPSALPAVAISQADLLVAHRLTAAADLDALACARPTYLSGGLVERLPGDPGEAVVVDDVTETVQTVRIRERGTPHGGTSPRASARLSTDAEDR